MTRRRSRLSRKIEKETKKNLFFSILGIIAVLFLMLKFGIPLLANFALFLSGSKQGSLPLQTSTEFIMASLLNPLPSATNSANFTLSGKSQSQAIIDFYLNDSLIDKTQADKDGNFSFKSQFLKGDNKIYVLTKLDNKKSNPSETLNVLFKDSKPNLTTVSPSDGQQFSKDQNEANVSGTTDPQVKITVNGFWAIVDQNNSFSYKLRLQNGDNTIKIGALDLAGNKTEKELKVKYSP